MTAREAWGWLERNRYLSEPTELGGWRTIIAAPDDRDLHRFVSAIKTLGAWSTSPHVQGVRVAVSTGREPYELAFRLEST